MAGEVVLVRRSKYQSERENNKIIRRGDSGEGRERKVGCRRVDAIRLSVVHATLAF